MMISLQRNGYTLPKSLSLLGQKDFMTYQTILSAHAPYPCRLSSSTNELVEAEQEHLEATWKTQLNKSTNGNNFSRKEHIIYAISFLISAES